MPKGQLSRVLGQGTLGCHSLFSLLFRRFSSLTFTITQASYPHWTSTSLHSICYISVQEEFYKVPRGHIKATPGHGHLKGPLATSKWHALLVYSGCHHGRM